MNTPAKHNIGFDRPRLTHNEYVRYLYDCARRWSQQSKEQAEHVLELANTAAAQDENTCQVCLKAR